MLCGRLNAIVTMPKPVYITDKLGPRQFAGHAGGRSVGEKQDSLHFLLVMRRERAVGRELVGADLECVAWHQVNVALAATVFVTLWVCEYRDTVRRNAMKCDDLRIVLILIEC